MCATFELKATDSEFNDMYLIDVLSGLMRNGYTLELTPCRYSDNSGGWLYTLMVEVGDIDESFEEIE